MSGNPIAAILALVVCLIIDAAFWAPFVQLMGFGFAVLAEVLLISVELSSTTKAFS